MIIFYYLTLILLLIYSFVHVDPSMTLINHPLWETFRNVMVQIGFHQRAYSTLLFVIIMTLLVIAHVKIMQIKKINPLRVAMVTALILLLSYPFLSRDLFNYMFDARIVTWYQANPYIHAALDFPSDPWLRFMHWTHRTYPYGPSFLMMTIIPSLLSMGKFILSFIFFKGLWMGVYILGVATLNKINKSYALFFATHPLVIIEGLVNVHNDLLAVVFALLAILLRKNIFKWFSILISIGVKYITIPGLLLIQHTKTPKRNVIVSVVLFTIFLGYLSLSGEIQQWYFLNYLVLIPFVFFILRQFHIFTYGILISYYPYILYGAWDSQDKLLIKHTIIIVGFIINLLYIKLFHKTYE